MGQILLRLTVCSGVILAMLAPAASQAAELNAKQGIGVSPTSQEVSLAPGASYNGQITVINDGQLDVRYKVYATDYSVSNESYVGNFDSSAKQANVSPVSWFTLPLGTFTVKSQVETTFDYTVTAPATATPGGHYAAVFVETIPPAAKGSALVSRIDRVGTLMYIAVTGALHQSGSLLPLSVPFLQSVAPVTGTLRVRNDGNVHFLAEGTVQLYSLFGAAQKAVPIKGEVLPGTTRKFDFALPAGSPIGFYNVTANVKYLDRTEQVTQWMLLMPRVTFLILAGTIMVLLGAAFATLVRRAKKRRQKRDKPE